jgi:hypothetical protein
MQTRADALAMGFVRRLVDAVGARDLEQVCALQHPEIVMESAEERGRTIRGAEEARRHARRILEENDMLAVALGSADVLADDLVLVRLSLRSSIPSGGHRHHTQCLLWRIKDGLLWRQYAGSEEELRARAADIVA